MTDSKVFKGVDFPKLEEQRLALSFILAAADKDVRSQHVEISLEELEGLQNFLDHITDVACEMYGEETVLPMMTEVDKLIEEQGAKIIQYPASVGKTKKDE